jgi:hypothetical protein
MNWSGLTGRTIFLLFETMFDLVEVDSEDFDGNP